MASKRPRLRKLLEKIRLAKRVPIATESVATTTASEMVFVMISSVLGRKSMVAKSSCEIERTRRMR